MKKLASLDSVVIYKKVIRIPCRVQSCTQCHQMSPDGLRVTGDILKLYYFFLTFYHIALRSINRGLYLFLYIY